MTQIVTPQVAQNLQQACTVHPNKSQKRMGYGTSGFRANATTLDHIVFRSGLVAALRALSANQATGLMITASHNPVHDNGVKLIDPSGEMLVGDWEPIATTLANVADADIVTAIDEIIKAHINVNTDLSKACVYLGRDTRPSSTSLAKAASDAITALGVKVQDFGLVTTPQLHYMVMLGNQRNSVPTLEDYYENVAKAYKNICGDKVRRLVVDCAHGVGGPKVSELVKYLQPSLELVPVNSAMGEEYHQYLNERCGAEYVQKDKGIPLNIKLGANVQVNERIASLDGDSDRVVYFYIDAEGELQLVDGDKIASLAAIYIKSQLDILGVDQNTVRVGVVQTAYANGSSMQYLRDNLGAQAVSCVATGVKHLHHRAKEDDIGIYFEANGHGTVLFSSKALQNIQNATDKCKECGDISRYQAGVNLLNLAALINPAIGDAITDFLMVEAILSQIGWDIQKWNSIYTDLPSKMRKVLVKDRLKITTTVDETRCTSPTVLQDTIDALVAKYTKIQDNLQNITANAKPRSFVRPSGTEDLVRVYAEAATQELADNLAQDVCQAVFDLVDGIKIE